MFEVVCAYVREDNPQDLSPVHSQSHTTTCLLHQHAFALRILRDIWLLRWNIVRLLAYCKGGNFNIHIWANKEGKSDSIYNLVKS